jgi:hypothetical protein
MKSPVSPVKVVEVFFLASAIIILGAGAVKIGNQGLDIQGTLSKIQGEKLAGAYIFNGTLPVIDVCPVSPAGTQLAIPEEYELIDGKCTTVPHGVQVFYNQELKNTLTHYVDDTDPNDVGFTMTFSLQPRIESSRIDQKMANNLALYYWGYRSLKIETTDLDHCLNIAGMQASVPEGYHWDIAANNCYQIITVSNGSGCTGGGTSNPTVRPQDAAQEQVQATGVSAVYLATGCSSQSSYYVGPGGVHVPVTGELPYNTGLSETFYDAPFTTHIVIPARTFVGWPIDKRQNELKEIMLLVGRFSQDKGPTISE